MHLIDPTNTSHSKANTGIQRYCRELYNALLQKQLVQAITWDPYLKAWRGLDTEEKGLLDVESLKKVSSRRRPTWSIRQKLTGYARRCFYQDGHALKNHFEALIVPEVFSEDNYNNLPRLASNLDSGPRIAIFHDSIPLKFPHLSSPKTIARLSCYMQQLATFDAVAPNSEASKNDLLEAWNALHIKNIPLVKALPLCVEQKNEPKIQFSYDKTTKNILCVGSIEGRKNHVALLEAAETLWAKGEDFQLTLVGLLNHESGQKAKTLIDALKEKKRDLRWLGSVNEEILNFEYSQAYFTIYPSLYEGFGLPVLESLVRGIPCVSSMGGALKETAQGGGCLLMEDTSSQSIADCLARLLHDEALHRALVQEALNRKFRTWDEYTDDLLDLIEKAKALKGSGTIEQK